MTRFGGTAGTIAASAISGSRSGSISIGESFAVRFTALETSLVGTLHFILHKGEKSPYPRAETPTHYIAMGFDDDLSNATRKALRNMIDFLVADRHMTRDDAYQLLSVAGDVEITELVDRNKGVHVMLPKALFTGR